MASTKRVFGLLLFSFFSCFTLIKLSCSNVDLIESKVNSEIGSLIKTRICQNEHIQPILINSQYDILKEDLLGLKQSIKTYPYTKTAKEYKHKTEQYILNFDFQKEYAGLKRFVIVNYEQLKNFIFLKYQLLILKDAKWKQMYAKKADTESIEFNKVVVTGIDQVKKAITQSSLSTTSGESPDHVPATSTGTSSPTNNALETAGTANQFSFDYSTLKDRVAKKAENMVASIEKDLNKLQVTKVGDMKPNYVKKIQGLNEFANERMLVLSTMIREINNCQAVNGSYFFNSTAMECEYAPITRENFREYFKNTQSMLESQSKELVEVDYKNDVADFEENLEALRLNYVDLFEDWGDSILTKLKEVLVIENMSSDNSYEEMYDEDYEEGAETLEKWQEFVSLKNDIIERRDYLLNFELDLNEIQDFVSELKRNIGILAHEGGDRLYIIRAKANLEFQDREKIERESKLLKEQEEEERKKEQSKAKTIKQDKEEDEEK